MFSALIAADPSPVTTLFDGIQTQLTADTPLIVAGIGGVAVFAFSIKGLWVAWRAASKAVGKAGS